VSRREPEPWNVYELKNNQEATASSGPATTVPVAAYIMVNPRHASHALRNVLRHHLSNPNPDGKPR